ncbi:biotin transporter BioY [Lichenifustis flavocetrariae]|uniref:Biotin transporter n=1 Tax=Lichenifustis flavocetrariae TaxID=2949735 RepID=A0AA41Z000_9HYPH|nr:biotin transporter BioY [Lichenifustis flavocetrariae]MCW6507960.1 biotin transporter BioY [Lichenifustis flavocetrariae]
MSISALATDSTAYVPLRLRGKPVLTRVLAVLAASMFLAACSWISVPLLSVPMTMQTFGVTLVGALFGWRLGAASVLLWLGEAALGMPVLSAGSAGPAYMMGPTGGYLVAFVIAAALVGWCAERGVTSWGLVSSFGLMVVANALILLVGAAWLAHFVGPHKAIALGITPFIVGGLLKAALATGAIEAARLHLPFR